jgi:hypothetical protein
VVLFFYLYIVRYALGSSDCWMTSARKIGRNVEGGGRVVIHRNVAAFAWRERRKQDSQFLGRSLDLGPPEYEVGMLSIDRDVRCRQNNSAKPESSCGGILAHSVCLVFEICLPQSETSG